MIIWEGDPADPTRKPPEMYTLIENFCLGLRRLEIFGKRSSLRRGWVTVLAPGQEESLPYTTDGSGKFPVDAPAMVVGDENDADESAHLNQLMYATRWLQSTWDEGIKELTNTGAAISATNTVGGLSMGMSTSKSVVPMTAEIDALRPKSPVRGGHQGSGL